MISRRPGLAGDFARARDIHYKIMPVMRNLFTETNPIPLKQALPSWAAAPTSFGMPLMPDVRSRRRKAESGDEGIEADLK